MCGCGKKTSPRRAPLIRPASSARSSTPPMTTAQFRALGSQASVPKTASRLDADRLRIEKLRREAVKRSLNK